MEVLLPYIPTDRRHALARGESLPNHCQGAALFVDISGFTPLAEGLAQHFGPQRGAEELTQYLNQVYDALIAELDRYRGSAIGFSGDAMTCWFDGDDGAGSVSCALQMQQTMLQFGAISLESGDQYPLTAKAGIAVGAARRFVVGDPELQLLDVLAGRLLDEMAEAEHHASGGQVVLGPSAMEALDGRVEIERVAEADGRRFGQISAVSGEAGREPWGELDTGSLTEPQVRSWLLDPVYQRLRSGQGEFLAELRPAVALFLKFEGLDYDGDEQAGEKLDQFIRQVQQILAGYEGTLVDITTGDKGSYLYIAFGAPIAHEDDVERAASAALDLRAAAAAADFLTAIQIGINRGRMRTGAYGGNTRRTYGVLGDATNLAARLMTSAQPGEILLTQSTADRVEHAFAWEDHPDITVKGKREPIAVAGLLSRSEASVRDRPAGRQLLPMVGREQELEILRAKIDLALDGHGQVVGITAEAGMGKSRLVAEAVRAARTRGMELRSGECKSYGMHASYLVWSTVWRQILRIGAELPEEEQIEALRAKIADWSPDLVERIPLLGPLLNITIPDTELTQQFDPQSRKVLLERVLLELLTTVARKRPILIVLEDTHWIDPLSVDLLKAFSPPLSTLPILVLLAYRPDGVATTAHANLAGREYFTEIPLTHLASQHAKQWIDIKTTQLYGPDVTPPSAFANRLMERADGNPFYIEEVLNYLRDHDISPQDRQALSELDLPTSLDSLVLTRIDRRDERPRSTLRVASVFGRTFSASHLQGAYPKLNESGGIDSVLDVLSRKGFVDREGGDSYSFRHGLIQEATYGSLPFTFRLELHGSVAEFLELAYADSIGSAVDLLAYHYFKGEIWPKAFDYNLRSAQQAEREYSNAAAISAAENALAAAGHIGSDLDIRSDVMSAHHVLGDVLSREARYEESVEAFTRSIEVANGWEDLFSESRAWYGLAETQIHKGDFREAIASAEQAEAISTAAGLKLAPIKSRWMQAWGAYRLGEVETAFDLARSLAEPTSALGDQEQRALNLNLIGMLSLTSGNYDEAERSFAEAFDIFDQAGDQRGVMPLINNLGLVAESRGQLSEAAAKYSTALAVAGRVGDRDGEIVYLGNLGRVKALQGEFAEAESDLSLALDKTESGGTDFLSEVLSSLAEAVLGQGRTDEALKHATQALDIALNSKALEDQGRAWRALGMVLARMEESPSLQLPPSVSDSAVDAHGAFAEAARRFADVQRRDELARTLRLWAEYEHEAGDASLGLEKWNEAKVLYEKLGIEEKSNQMGELG